MNFGAAGQFLMTIYKIWETNMKKTIITVVGKDKVGIIAKVFDISQTIIDGFFNMMMITDTTDAEKSTKDIRHELHQIGEEIGVSIHVQHEDIFEMMHRI